MLVVDSKYFGLSYKFITEGDLAVILLYEWYEQHAAMRLWISYQVMLRLVDTPQRTLDSRTRLRDGIVEELLKGLIRLRLKLSDVEVIIQHAAHIVVVVQMILSDTAPADAVLCHEQEYIEDLGTTFLEVNDMSVSIAIDDDDIIPTSYPSANVVSYYLDGTQGLWAGIPKHVGEQCLVLFLGCHILDAVK